MNDIIKSKNDLCVGCNRCVRECPMEMANNTFLDDAGNIKVRVDNEKCISCGRCISACKHNARYYEDDTGRFFDDLKAGVPISLIAAPSIRTNVPEYKRLFTYLKRLGVNRIYDVSLGADISIWAHIRYIEQNPKCRIITQPCPVIVTYCEVYRHDLLKWLSPVHGPTACISIYMKEYQGISDRIAAFSPCIAKTKEFRDTGLAQYNVTFAKLSEYLEENNITLPDEETPFDHDEAGLGSLFPIPGGLKVNIEYFLGNSIHITKGEGFNIYEKLRKYAEMPEEFLPDVFDVLNCIEGCNGGPASTQVNSVFEIDKTMYNSKKSATETQKRKHYESVYKKFDDTFDISHFKREYKPVLVDFPQIADEDIEAAFKLLGKDSYELQNIDCSACGSKTCLGMARKIALDVNIPINCIVKAMEDARTEHDNYLIAHDKLLEAVDAAQEASRTKSAFLANMSHEIRTPMNAITGMLELLAHETLSDRQMSFVSDISVSANTLLDIINDILDMSKIESGKLELNPVDYVLRQLLDNITSMFAYVVHNKGLEFKVEIADELPECLYGDDLRLKQVLTNICGNAVKFTEKGYVKLTATVDGDRLVFNIEDTGMGIRKEDMPTLFKAYEQANRFKTRGVSGTGLGLSISKYFVELMGGEITVESEYGYGTAFTVTIPIVEGNLRNIIKSEVENAWQTLSAPDARILVVDDNEFNLKVASGLLSLMDIDAETADSGLEAIELVSKHDYDIVFMDHMMPEMDGVETVRRIRAMGGKYKGIIIIALTANVVKSARDLFFSSGFDDFVAKPIDTSELREIVRKHLPPEKVLTELNSTLQKDHQKKEEELRRRTIVTFVKENKNTLENITNSLNSGDTVTAHRIAHTLKSSAGYLGRIGLQNAAFSLERSLQSKPARYAPKQLAALKTELEKTLLEYKSLCDEMDSGRPDSVQVDEERKSALLSELEPLLKRGDFGAISFVKELQSITGMEELAELIDEYDFESASKVLDTLKQNKTDP